MTTVRRATAADADALTRVRAANMLQADPEAGWAVRLCEHLHTGLADGTRMAAFVIDAPSDATNGNLASCALGTIHQHLPSPRHSGLTGHVHLVATAAVYRRLGYATAVLNSLVDWLHHQGCKVINLNATSEGDRLYRPMGFTSNPMAMRLACRYPPREYR